MLECTKDMENITLSPSAVTKLKTRKSANKIRHGSPKLQEVLREVSQRCYVYAYAKNIVNLNALNVQGIFWFSNKILLRI